MKKSETAVRVVLYDKNCYHFTWKTKTSSKNRIEVFSSHKSTISIQTINQQIYVVVKYMEDLAWIVDILVPIGRLWRFKIHSIFIDIKNFSV